jgi:hypothetical protein
MRVRLDQLSGFLRKFGVEGVNLGGFQAAFQRRQRLAASTRPGRCPL